MSDESDDNDKQFDPSQKKLDDARAKGEIAKSTDLITAAAYAGMLLVMLTIGPAALMTLGTTLSVLLEQSDDLARIVFVSGETAVMGGIMQQAIIGVAPWFAFPAVLAILSIIAQRAFVFAPSKITPKANRISLISGLKNKFGRQGLFEFFKSMTKLLIYSVIMGAFLLAQSDRIIGSLRLSAGQVVAELGTMLVVLTAIVLVVALVIGGVDFLFQQAEHIRKNRMSRKDIMDELKQSEGDPAMKQQRRQKGYEIAMNKMLVDVPKADVVVVNPTHYAVALKWDRLSGQAPVCVAKGQDEVALRIREIAREHGIPLHSDPPTARALFATVDIGDQIARDQYRAVAAAIRFAETVRRKAGRR